ncbi:hypothetical protein FMUND_5236 [Fusarium mundagurra]|uniref:BZIP domain-containing protein n=1 Tax=Fusarium mundagurra TaxID=1567541 RepID=A0A8H6DI89_9HYPO|nr:hypothetical protein FMUND_5236 [Fusarium mundagurra]
MLVRGGNDAQSTNQFAATSGVPGHAHPAPVAPQRINPSQQMSSVHWDPIGSARGMSMISVASDESEQVRLNTRSMGKRNPSPTNGRRKADEPTVEAPTIKKSKTNAAATNSDMDFSDEESTMGLEESVSISKMTNEEKRKNFLERNRVAAHKCRLRRKHWLTQLQTKVELFTTENHTLMAQIAHLREETVNLKTLLFAHKDCPVAYQQELYSASMSQTMENCREECARSVCEAIVEGFNNAREPIRHAVNDGLQDGIREGQGIMRDTIQNCIQAEIRLAQENIVDTVNNRNKNGIDGTDDTELALRWWDEFLRHTITISVFGGSITLTVIVQAIQDPAELNKDSRFHHDTVRIFLTVAWLLFVSALALALVSSLLLPFEHEATNRAFGGGLPSILPMWRWWDG